MRNQINNLGLKDFEGYSPNEMEFIMEDMFGVRCPIKLLRMSEEDYKKVPILKMVKYLLQIIQESGELQLTKKVFLQTKTVADIYKQGFYLDPYIESGVNKLYKETDSMLISFTSTIIQCSNLVKKRHNKLSLTKKGSLLLADNFKLMPIIFKTFGEDIKWSHFDGFGENFIGQIAYGYSIILLSKYGNEQRDGSFYALKYFKAFPRLFVNIAARFGTLQEFTTRCYTVRTFERFLDFFGIIKIERGAFQLSDIKIEKTPLFDKLIHRSPHTSDSEIMAEEKASWVN